MIVLWTVRILSVATTLLTIQEARLSLTNPATLCAMHGVAWPNLLTTRPPPRVRVSVPHLTLFMKRYQRMYGDPQTKWDYVPPLVITRGHLNRGGTIGCLLVINTYYGPLVPFLRQTSTTLENGKFSLPPSAPSESVSLEFYNAGWFQKFNIISPFYNNPLLSMTDQYHTLHYETEGQGENQ